MDGEVSAADMVATWSKDYTQRTFPFTLGHAARNSAEVITTMPMLQRVIRGNRVSVKPYLDVRRLIVTSY